VVCISDKKPLMESDGGDDVSEVEWGKVSH